MKWILSENSALAIWILVGTLHHIQPEAPRRVFYALTLWTRTVYIYAQSLLPVSANGAFIRLRYILAHTARSEAKQLLGVNPLFSSNCWGHAFSLTSLSKPSRKGRYYFVSDRDLVKGCRTRSFFSDEWSKRPPVFNQDRSTTFK